MTRKQIATALDKFLGTATNESVLRELRSSIVRTREARSNPRRLASSRIRDFVDTLTRRRMTASVLKRVRIAVAETSRAR